MEYMEILIINYSFIMTQTFYGCASITDSKRSIKNFIQFKYCIKIGHKVLLPISLNLKIQPGYLNGRSKLINIV